MEEKDRESATEIVKENEKLNEFREWTERIRKEKVMEHEEEDKGSGRNRLYRRELS